MLNFDWLADVSVETAKFIFLGMFALLGIMILIIPKEFIYKGIEKIEWWHNLKIWSLALLSLIAYTYYIF